MGWPCLSTKFNLETGAGKLQQQEQYFGRSSPPRFAAKLILASTVPRGFR
jgi:hypothetical protein